MVHCQWGRGARSCLLDRCAAFRTWAEFGGAGRRRVGNRCSTDSRQELAAPSGVLDVGSTVPAAPISSPRGSLVLR